MRVIPVLDLLGGLAVHARAGDRASYAPLRSRLARNTAGDARAVVRAIRRTVGSNELYLADLDAIMGRTPQRELTRELAREFAGNPDRSAAVWIDAGVTSAEQAREAAEDGATRIIVGLETLSPQHDPRSTLRSLAVAVGLIGPKTVGPPDPRFRGAPSAVFSVDLRAGRPLTSHPALRDLSPLAIAELAAECGMRTIIALELGRVGMATGPDIELLRELRRALPGVELVVGGGTRDAADLRRLADEGADAALVGSALHYGPEGQGLVLDPLGAVPPDVTSPLADD